MENVLNVQSQLGHNLSRNATIPLSYSFPVAMTISYIYLPWQSYVLCFPMFLTWSCESIKNDPQSCGSAIQLAVLFLFTLTTVNPT